MCRFSGYKIEGSLDGVSKTGLDFIPDFKINEFISAHFLLNTHFDDIINIILLLNTTFIIYILLKRSLDS
jgi:hypothetical protein